MRTKYGAIVLALLGLFFLMSGLRELAADGLRWTLFAPFFMSGVFSILSFVLYRYEPTTKSNDLLNLEFVTVATYSKRPPADMAKLFLEQNGIESFVIDDNTVTADWFLGPALGWIKLQVAGKDAPAAIAFLESHPNLLKSSQVKETDADEVNQCLHCGKALGENAKSCDACGWTFSDADAEDETQEKEKAQG